jgi:hypothetical protein
MRKILLSLLLATTAVTPALAQRTTAEERAEEREKRQAKQAEARKERTESRQETRTERVDNRQDARTERVDNRQDARTERVQNRQQAHEQNLTVRERSAATQQRQQQRQDARENRQESRQQYVDRANQVRQRLRPPAGARPDQPAPPPQTARSNVKTPQWHSTWRNDNRYDWRRWRDRNHSLFNLGLYFDPFGWGYRRYNVGWRLWPSYYNDSYWLNDPYMYRLPYAPWPYKWVRYYDDALLVNTYNGEVVDVMYDFFW